MLHPEHLVVIRGGGDLGTGVAWELNRAGFPVVVCELAEPLAIRRRVALSTAVAEGRIEVDGLRGVLVPNPGRAQKAIDDRTVPVMVAPALPPPEVLPRFAVVDARMAKQSLDTSLADASLVVGLGPGLVAGRDCHAVVETVRGEDLGRVIWEGSAQADTGVPGEVGGHSADRVIRAPEAGRLRWKRQIGDLVAAGEVLGRIDRTDVVASLSGVIRGLLADDRVVAAGAKIGDVDPRADRSLALRISDKAHAVGLGVVEAVVARMGH